MHTIKNGSKPGKHTSTDSEAQRHVTVSESPLAAADQFVDQKKSFATLVAPFALKGHTLQKLTRANDNATLYVVSRWGQSRMFSHLHDVQGFLAQIGGQK